MIRHRTVAGGLHKHGKKHLHLKEHPVTWSLSKSGMTLVGLVSELVSRIELCSVTPISCLSIIDNYRCLDLYFAYPDVRQNVIDVNLFNFFVTCLTSVNTQDFYFFPATFSSIVSQMSVLKATRTEKGRWNR